MINIRQYSICSSAHFFAQLCWQHPVLPPVGIGSIPDSVLASLTEHKDLGVHTEMFSDGVVDLVEAGVITNANKIIHPGKIVTGFVVGTKRVYDFIHNNPSVG